MLFSEPKIPQSIALGGNGTNDLFQCSSASRKFLNLQEHAHSVRIRQVSVLFSEPKIPQSRSSYRMSQPRTVSVLFSEPKIPQFGDSTSPCTSRTLFQCSSASRKFLNVRTCKMIRSYVFSFSALQRAENSSISVTDSGDGANTRVSVLFSEPKIPQSIQ